MTNLIIVGIGGIGSHLLYPLLQYLNSTEVFESVVLVDGDKYEEKNKARQIVTGIGQNKAYSTKEYYKELFHNIRLSSEPRYLNAENISEVIDEQDVILLCVDNNKTRKLIEDHCDGLKNFILISGGNELYDGNVQIVVKRYGKYLTKKLSESHPEIANGEDRHPEELSCDELSESAPQISIVNAAVADIMRRVLFAMNQQGIKYEEVYVNCTNGNIRNVPLPQDDTGRTPTIALFEV